MYWDVETDIVYQGNSAQVEIQRIRASGKIDYLTVATEAGS